MRASASLSATLPTVIVALCLIATSASAQPAQRQARDPMQEGLPLKPARTVSFTTRVGNWMSLDVSPEG